MNESEPAEENMDLDDENRWYWKAKFNTLDLVIISAWAVLYTVLIFILGAPARAVLPAAPLYLLPAMVWGTYMFVLLSLIIRKRFTMIMFSIPLAVLFAVSPAQTGFPHWFKGVSLIIHNIAVEIPLLLFPKKERIAAVLSGAVMGVAIFLVFILSLWYFGVTFVVNASFDAMPVMIPAGIVLGAAAGLAAQLTYSRLRTSGMIKMIRTRS